MSNRKVRKVVVHFLKKYDVQLQIISLAILIASIPISLAFFPDDTMATFLMVSITGVLNGLATLAESLTDLDEAQKRPEDEVDAEDAPPVN